MKFYFCCLFTLLTSIVPLKRARAGSLILNWAASSSPGVAGYNVYFGTTAGNYPNKVSAGLSTSVTISGLTAGVTYYFVATAYDLNGRESAPSTPTEFRLPTALTLVKGTGPGQPVVLQFPVQPGRHYEVQAAADALHWQTIWRSSLGLGAGWMQIADAASPGWPARYYRLVWR